MNTRVFWLALGVQGALVAGVFVLLVGLPLTDDFFDDYGVVVGPFAWIACAALTARILSLPIGFVLFSALAGGVAGTIVLLVASHWAGMVAALLVFGASCAGYDPEALSGSPRGDSNQRFGER